MSHFFLCLSVPSQTNVRVKDAQWRISLHFLRTQHRGDDGLFLIFPQLSLQIKPLGLIFQRGASAGLKGKDSDTVVSVGRRLQRKWTPASLENANTHHPAGAKEERDPILLIKARTLEHEQPRHKARDKKKKSKQKTSARHQGAFWRDNPHMKSIMGAVCARP